MPVVVVHWDGEGEPSTAARRSLADWAEARGVHLAQPSQPPLAAAAAPLAVADEVEELLERAKDAITAADAPGAAAALAKAETDLRAHPDLPEAAWLLAETLRLDSLRLRRLAPRDDVAAARAWARAAALDGGRVAGVGEVSADGHAATGEQGERPVVVEGLTTRDLEPIDLRIDGAVVRAGSRSARTTPGEHQVTLTRRSDAALVWAAWVTFGSPDEPAVVRVTLPRGEPCSSVDLRAARPAGDAIDAVGVLCPRWIFVRELPDRAGRGSLRVASCEGETCGPSVDWREGSFGPVLPDRRAAGSPWPAWATWTIAGASVVGLAAACLAASGAFRPTHEETVFTGGLLRMSSTGMRARPGE